MASRAPDPENVHSVFEVFTPTTQARLNFVDRKSVNDQLVDSLRTPGKQLVIYGETGSGKSTLLSRKLEQLYGDHITSRCYAGSTFEQLMLDAFDQLDKYYLEGISTTQTSSRSSGLAIEFSKIRASLDSSLTRQHAGEEKRVVPPQLTPQRLGQFLGHLGMCWVLEDFHKVAPDHKRHLAQSLKIFSDLADEHPLVKVIAIGATEAARQVVEYDRELANRVSELMVPLMDDAELAEIVYNGQQLLNLDLSAVQDLIVKYSSGVASVSHQLCLNLCVERELLETAPDLVTFARHELEDALERYVRESSDSLKASFDLALKRHKVRQYDNCRLILTALAAGPLDGMPFGEILSHIRIAHPRYPAGNLTNYLAQLTSEQRGNLVRHAGNGFYRFVDPLHHTYAQASLRTADHGSATDVEELTRLLRDTVSRSAER